MANITSGLHRQAIYLMLLIIFQQFSTSNGLFEVFFFASSYYCDTIGVI